MYIYNTQSGGHEKNLGHWFCLFFGEKIIKGNALCKNVNYATLCIFRYTCGAPYSDMTKATLTFHLITTYHLYLSRQVGVEYAILC